MNKFVENLVNKIVEKIDKFKSKIEIITKILFWTILYDKMFEIDICVDKNFDLLNNNVWKNNAIFDSSIDIVEKICELTSILRFLKRDF